MTIKSFVATKLIKKLSKFHVIHCYTTNLSKAFSEKNTIANTKKHSFI